MAQTHLFFRNGKHTPKQLEWVLGPTQGDWSKTRQIKKAIGTMPSSIARENLFIYEAAEEEGGDTSNQYGMGWQAGYEEACMWFWTYVSG